MSRAQVNLTYPEGLDLKEILAVALVLVRLCPNPLSDLTLVFFFLQEQKQP